ncbi:hypothetical protein D047_0296B, partial [Vibrio parahaemolyticus VPTS-2010_2]
CALEKLRCLIQLQGELQLEQQESHLGVGLLHDQIPPSLVVSYHLDGLHRVQIQKQFHHKRIDLELPLRCHPQVA